MKSSSTVGRHAQAGKLLELRLVLLPAVALRLAARGTARPAPRPSVLAVVPHRRCPSAAPRSARGRGPSYPSTGRAPAWRVAPRPSAFSCPGAASRPWGVPRCAVMSTRSVPRPLAAGGVVGGLRSLAAGAGARDRAAPRTPGPELPAQPARPPPDRPSTRGPASRSCTTTAVPPAAIRAPPPRPWRRPRAQRPGNAAPRRPRPPPPPIPTAASTLDLSPSVGATGSATASIWRWRLDLLAELAAAGALAQVQPQLGAPQRAPAQVGELLADLLAGQLARLAARDQRRTRPVHERLHARPPRSRAPPRCPPAARPPTSASSSAARCSSGSSADVGQQLAQLGAPLDLLGQARRGELE